MYKDKDTYIESCKSVSYKQRRLQQRPSKYASVYTQRKTERERDPPKGRRNRACVYNVYMYTSIGYR